MSQPELCLPFPSDQIAALPSGVIRLHVPLVDNVIQVGSMDECNIGSIVINTVAGTTTIERDNGCPLMAEMVITDDFLQPDDPYRTVRIPIFEGPIRRLAIRPDIAGNTTDVWTPYGEKLVVPDPEFMDTFCETLGSYCLIHLRDKRSVA